MVKSLLNISWIRDDTYTIYGLRTSVINPTYNTEYSIEKYICNRRSNLYDPISSSPRSLKHNT